MYVGNAENETLKSGTTVLYADKPFNASVDVRGGAPGTRETELLSPDKLVSAIDAIVLSGGSAFGLDAAGGVMDELRQQGRGFAVGDVRVPIVSAAIIFDLLNGGNKQWRTNPYPDLGRFALQNSAVDFDLGSCGAGIGATTANLKGGLGSASIIMPNGCTVGALVVVNARGSVVTGERGQFWAAPFEVGNEFGGQGVCTELANTDHSNTDPADLPGESAGANTTIAIVATDAALNTSQLKRLATASHDGLARAIVPAHTLFDGDLVYTVSTEVKGSVDPATEAALGHAASICLSRAIARGVFCASAAAKDTLPCWQDKYG